jgi:hypothetical protein|tara:strand:- start:12552 stop:13337 length:786 start_codon:yes stop_codon:yes gene_type:complete
MAGGASRLIVFSRHLWRVICCKIIVLDRLGYFVRNCLKLFAPSTESGKFSDVMLQLRPRRYFISLIFFTAVHLGSAQSALDPGYSLSGNTFGFSLETESHGTGIGVFYTRVLARNLQFFSQFKLLSITGETEMPVYDPYTGYTRKVGEVNLVLVPLFIGLKFHPFIGQIANNFSPFAVVLAGPLGILDSPENVGFSQQIREMKSSFHGGAFLGIGADFQIQTKQFVSIALGYDFLPMGKDVDGKNEYSGTLFKIMMGRKLN